MTISRLRLHRGERMLIILAMIFGWLGAGSLWLQNRDLSIIGAVATLSLVAVLSHVGLNWVAPARDPLLLPTAVLMTMWGLLVIARVAPNFLGRQLAWVIVGYTMLFAVASSPDRLRWLRRFKYTWLLASLALLAATLLLGVNPTGAGARLWLSVAGLFVQPSEILRLLMITFLAAFFSERVALSPWRFEIGQPIVSHLKALGPLAPSFVMWLIAFALLASQQDLGAGALLLFTFVFMLYLATGRALLPVAGLLVLLIAGAAGYALSARIAQRIDIWVNPWIDPQGSSFQIVQSLIAVASGGVFGQGLGQGRPEYVPAVHTDFPFAAIGEEFGVLGAVALLIGLAILSLRAWRIARHAPSAYALLLAGGLAASLATQVFVIVGGNLGLLPLTGVTLPFVSYGGSSLLVSLITIGLLIRLSCDYIPGPSPEAVSKQVVPAGSDAVLRATPVQRTAAHYATRLCGGMFTALALVAGYQGIIQQPALLARDDNPRKVEAEHAIQRGAILARDGTLLAISNRQDGDDFPPVYERHYPHAETTSVIGYYSLRHGVGGIEAYADAILRGQSSFVDRLMHHIQIGTAFTTTIDVHLQRTLSEALRKATGSAILMDWRTGEVLALVSTPSFDPNTLDDHWDVLKARADAPLIDRATQGLYQPGALLGWMAEHIVLAENAKMDRTGQATYRETTARFDLGETVPFELENAAVPYSATATYSDTIGQGQLRITPLRVATVAASIAAGKAVTPRLTYMLPANAPISAPETSSHPQQSTAPGRVPVTTMTTFAEMGAGQFVGWHVQAGMHYVLVIALEQHDRSPVQLHQIVDAISPALQ